MTADPRRRELLNNIAALPESKGLSQEEIRIADYIKAYSTTGRPPAPVPQQPAGDNARAALGLPPLFQPYIDFTPGSTMESINVVANFVPTVTDPLKLPKIHPFQAVSRDGDTYYTLSMMPEFLWFSLEELRCYAYAAGIKYPPTPLPTDLPPLTMPSSPSTPTSSSKSPPAITHPFFAKDTPETAFFKEVAPPGQDQILYYYTISADWQFKGHSLEELRIAFLQAGREINSIEINPQTAPSVPTLPALSPSSSAGPSTIRATPSGGVFAR